MRIHWNADGIAIGTEKDLLVMVYNAVPLDVHFTTLRTIELDLLRQHPGGMSILNLITRPSRMFDMPAKTRERATGLGKEMAPRTNVIANVVEGEGFFPAIARSIIASVAMLTSTPFPQKIFATLDEGAPWFIEHHNLKTPHKLTTDALFAMCTEIRREQLAAVPAPSPRA